MLGFSLKITMITLTTLALLAAAGWFAYAKLTPKVYGSIPSDVAKQLEFTPYTLTNNSDGYKQSGFEYTTTEDDAGAFYFIITLPDGTTVTTTEAPQPPQLTEIPESKAKFLENKSEETVLTDNGTIYLSHQKGRQDIMIGMMLERGLIILFNPSRDLSKTEWRALGNSLTADRSKMN